MDFLKATTTIKNRDTKKVGNNTYLVKINPETIGVRLHNTIIVRIHADGSYTLNSGGWRTVTTKNRINKFCPVRVFQRNHDWYIGEGEPFYDGIKVKSINGVACVGL